MPTGIDSADSDHEWVFRVRQPLSLPASRVIVLIHGWTGNENSMEIFAPSLPYDCLQIYPRGPIRSPDGGYGWVPARDGSLPSLEEFKPVCARFINALDAKLTPFAALNRPLDLVGFSQGAAMCYALALLFPLRFERIAALSGFMPGPPLGFELGNAKKIAFFIAHGSQDDTIPVELARQSAQILTQTGVEVDYCESDVGHKLASQCFKRLKSFLDAP